MAFIQTDETNFYEILSKEFEKGQIVILKFGSEYCDACMALEFELEDIDDENENVSILEIDCGESQELAMRYNVDQVPTMVIYKDKHSKLWDAQGVVLAPDIEKIIGL